MTKKKHILYIGNKLSSKGKTVTTIEELGGRLAAEGYTLSYASSVRNKVFRMLDMVYVFFKKASQTDVVLIDTYSTFNFYYAVIIATLCRLKKIPYITILHGGNLEQRLKGSPKLSQQLFGKAYTNVAPSKFLETVFKKYGFSKLTYIPNAIAINKYQFLERKTFSYKLLWVRSFASLYNPLMAVKVCEELTKQGCKASLCMVGPDKDGSLNECKDYAEKNKVNVIFTGLLSKQDWIKLAKEYDVFINTTTIDNTPVSLLEAMALGLPVVSTNVGGIPFLIAHENNGFLVPSADVHGMVEAVNGIVNAAEKTREVVTEAREYVSVMDWEHIKLKWNSLLQ